MKKFAILTMDVEDLYHLDYVKISKSSYEYSMLDGINNFAQILDKYKINANFFVVADIVNRTKNILNELINSGSRIGSHSMYHNKPNTLSTKLFEKNLILSKEIIQDTLSTKVDGFRAPCFSLDDERLKIVKGNGFLFDSSKINFKQHPLYGSLNLEEFSKLNDSVYKYERFYEFEVSTLNLLDFNFPVSGGGYLRIFPWWLMKKLISSYLKKNNIYTLYIHPFELSNKVIPKIHNLSYKSNLRMRLGRKSTMKKIDLLISLLKENGFEFLTFEDVIKYYEK